MSNDKYWLSLGPISPNERKKAFEYINRHKLPKNEETLRQRVARMRKRGALNRYLRGKEEAAADPNTPWQVIYGDTQVGGTITFIHTSGPTGASAQKDLYLHLIITIAAHEINCIRNIYFNNYGVSWDTDLTTRPTGLVEATGLFAGLVKLQINYGSDSQSALSVPVADTTGDDFPVGAKWTSNHRQRGHAHVYLRLKWHETIFKDGMPDITFRVSGKYNVVDPRTSTNSPGAANAAMVLYDYMTNTRWGLGASASEFNTTRLLQAVDDCEDSISLAGGGTENRYLINTHFGADASPGIVIEDMLASMHARLPYTEGKFSLLVGKERPSTILTITADMILSDINIVTKTPRSDNFNAVRGTFIAHTNSDEESDFPVVKNSTYETEDGSRIYEDMTFTMVTSATAVQRLAKIELESIRQGILVEFTARLDVYQAEPGEWVEVTYDRFGWTDKVFEVIRSALTITEDDNGNPFFAVQVTLQETSAGVYDWSTGDETTFDTAPNTNLPNPFTVSDPSALTLASGTSHLYMRLDGTIFARLYVSWTASPDAFVQNGGRYEIQYKKSADSAWLNSSAVPGSSTNTYILDVQDGQNYDVRIRAVSAMGQTGSWVTATGHTVIGKTAAPSAPTDVTATLQEYGIRVSWTPVTDLDVREYEIRLSTSGGAIGSSNFIAGVRSSPFYYEPKASGTYRFFVRAVDTSVNYSSGSVYADVTVSVPSTPTVSSATDGDGFLISWTAATGSFAIKEYEIRYGASFAAGTPVATVNALKFRVTGAWTGARTYWVAAKDIIGNVGTAGSVAITITAPAAPTVTATVEGEFFNLSWNAPSSTLPILSYEIRYGSSFGAGVSIATVSALRYRVRGEWSGERVFHIAARDSAGNVGTSGSYSAVITPPSSVKNLFSKDINGTTIIDWTPPSAGTMPVKRYGVYRGSVFSTATQVGLVDGSFLSLLQPNAGTYVYWVVAQDTAGNTGPEASTRLSVAQPNGFTLKYDQTLLASDATLVNASPEYDNLGVVGPMNLTETFAEHFTDNGATTIQGLIDSGLNYWGQPGFSGVGVADWEVDLGAVLRSASISTTYMVDGLAGNAVVLPRLSWKRNEADRWTHGEVGVTSQATTDYRFVRLTCEIGGDVFNPVDATLTNALDMLDESTILLPVPSDTWESHFVNNGVTTIQGFIDAGYTIFSQPSIAGDYGIAEWVTDCGEIIPSADIGIDFNIQQFDSTDSVLFSYSIETRRSLSDPWTVVIPRTDLYTPTAPTDYDPFSFFTGGTAGAWFDFGNSTTVLNGSAAIATDGQTVDTVNDSGSAGMTAVQTTDANRPTLRAAHINGRNAVELDTSDLMAVTALNAFTNGASSLTIGMVYSPTDGTTNHSPLRQYDGSYSYDRIYALLLGLQASLRYSRDGGDYTNLRTQSGSLSSADYHALLFVFDFNAGQTAIYGDDSTLLTMAAAGGSTVAGNMTATNANESRILSACKGFCAEMFFYKDAMMDSTQRTDWFAAVKTRFDLTTY